MSSAKPQIHDAVLVERRRRLLNTPILFCIGLHPTVRSNGTDFLKALEFRDSGDKIDLKRVEITRRRLSDYGLFCNVVPFVAGRQQTKHVN